MTKEKGDKRSRRGCLTFYIPDGLNTKGAKLLPCWWELMRSPKRNGLLTCTSNQDLPLLFNKREGGKRTTYEVRALKMLIRGWRTVYVQQRFKGEDCRYEIEFKRRRRDEY